MPDPNQNIEEWRLLQKILPSRNTKRILELEGVRPLLHIFEQEKQLLCGNYAIPGKKILHICPNVVWFVG